MASSKNKSLVDGNVFVPPLDQHDIDQIFTYYIKSGEPLYYCTSLYLQKSFRLYLQKRGRIIAAIYQRDIHDISMYRLGLDAPLSIIIGAELIRCHFGNRLIPILRPSNTRKAESYLIDLNNRAAVLSTTIDPTDGNTAFKVFDSILEKPLLPKEEYFLAGVETCKLLYPKAVEEVNLRFGISKAG